VIERLADRASDAVEVEDVSYHPVGLSQNLQDRPPYDRVVLVAAAARGRAAGTVSAYRWDGALPDTKEIQTRVSEAVTGVISLDNTLIVCGALGGFPATFAWSRWNPPASSGAELSPEIERDCRRSWRPYGVRQGRSGARDAGRDARGEGDERALLLLQLVDAIHRPALAAIAAGDSDDPAAQAVLTCTRSPCPTTTRSSSRRSRTSADRSSPTRARRTTWRPGG
jgi:hypothetical protein